MSTSDSNVYLTALEYLPLGLKVRGHPPRYSNVQTQGQPRRNEKPTFVEEMNGGILKSRAWYRKGKETQ